MLLEGCDENKETINSVISKLYRKAEFDLSKAQRAIVFLDGMDKIGANANISENGRKQVNSKVMDESFPHFWPLFYTFFAFFSRVLESLSLI